MKQAAIAVAGDVDVERSIDQRLGAFFDEVELPSTDIPVHLSVATPNARARAEWPNLPMAAMPSAGRMANGRGLTRAACRASCLGEAAELLSCCAWGDEHLVRATPANLGAAAIALDRLRDHSAAQLAVRDSWNATMGGFDWRPANHGDNDMREWVEVVDAHRDAPAYVPADMVFIGRRDAGDESAFAIADSNGCASGMSATHARLSAVLELIERDAVGRWWYGRRGRPLVAIDELEDAPELAAYLLGRSRVTRLYDITTDLAIPAYAAVSCERVGNDVAVGSAASVDPASGAISALTELFQMEVSLDTVRRMPGVSAEWDVWRRTTDMSVAPLCLAGPEQKLTPGGGEASNVAEAFDACVEACARAAISLYFVDMTRPQLGVPAFRALSPDLCHYKPRFGRRRLLAQDRRDLSRPDGAASQPNPYLLLV